MGSLGVEDPGNSEVSGHHKQTLWIKVKAEHCREFRTDIGYGFCVLGINNIAANMLPVQI